MPQLFKSGAPVRLTSPPASLGCDLVVRPEWWVLSSWAGTSLGGCDELGSSMWPDKRPQPWRSWQRFWDQQRGLSALLGDDLGEALSVTAMALTLEGSVSLQLMAPGWLPRLRTTSPPRATMLPLLPLRCHSLV